METLRALPDIAGRKFGNITIGYDRVDQIRGEVATLETLAALIMGCTREELTIQKIQAVLTDIQTRMSAMTAEDLETWRGRREPGQLIAVAAALQRTT